MNKISKYLFISLSAVTAGLLIAVGVMAFTGPGSNQPPAGNPTFWTLNGTNMYYNGGNVGIGTASPGYPLTVQGGYIKVGSVSSTALYLGHDGTTAIINSGHEGGGYKDLVFKNGGDEWMRIKTDGKIGIGVVSPSYKLDVAGDIRSAGQIYGNGAASTYGGISINGVKGGYSGINFRSGTTNYGTLMVHPDTQGFFNDTDNGWDWYWSNGTLTVGTIPWARISEKSWGAQTTVDFYHGIATEQVNFSCPSGYYMVGMNLSFSGGWAIYPGTAVCRQL
ncbi:MAG: hypothetical protein WC461_02400 [Candidatus Paceibacterota bacterium]